MFNVYLFRHKFHPGIFKALLLPLAMGGPILPPTKYETWLRRHRLELAIAKLKKEKEQLQVDVGNFPVLHIPDRKLA